MPLPDANDGPVTWLTIAAVIVALVWKQLLRIPHEWFNFRAESRENDAGAVQHDGYNDLIETQRAEIVRLAATVDHLSAELARERQGRYVAEEDAARLRTRVAQLLRAHK